MGCYPVAQRYVFSPHGNRKWNVLSEIDVVFLALPHSVSHKFVKENINKSNIIDLSADFRLDDNEIYNKNYKTEHSCPDLLDNFIYGLPEINHTLIQKGRNIAIPGCYPTSILLPLIPLLATTPGWITTYRS